MKCGCQGPTLAPQVSASEEFYWAAMATVCNNASLLQWLTSTRLSTSDLPARPQLCPCRKSHLTVSPEGWRDVIVQV